LIIKPMVRLFGPPFSLNTLRGAVRHFGSVIAQLVDET